jgi:hypothetical protein
MLDFRTLWDRALPYPEFLAASTKHKGLWEGIYAIARLPAWATGALVPGARRRLLVLAEDWCGDASSTIPLVAKLVDHLPGFELRVLRRDENPAVMDQYLTNGSRSIPIVIAVDQDYRELGLGDGQPRHGAQGGALSQDPAVVRPGSRREHGARGAGDGGRRGAGGGQSHAQRRG